MKSFTFSSKSGSNVFVALSERRKTASHWETKHIFGILENIKIAVLAMFFQTNVIESFERRIQVMEDHE